MKAGYWLGVLAGLAIVTATAVHAEPPEQTRGLERKRPGRPTDGAREGREERIRDGAPRLEELLKKYDADGDGKLSETERKAAWDGEKEARANAHLDEFFGRFDKDGNGCISREEAGAVFEAQREKMRNREPGTGERPGKDHDRKNKGNNGVGNGEDDQPPGNPPVNDGPGTGPGNPGNRQKNRT